MYPVNGDSMISWYDYLDRLVKPTAHMIPLGTLKLLQRPLMAGVIKELLRPLSVVVWVACSGHLRGQAMVDARCARHTSAS